MDKKKRDTHTEASEDQMLRNEGMEHDPGIGASISRNITDASLVEYKNEEKN
ncbi:hypothetical protein D1872_189970 [compost metagenome]|uniref:hypothetical protein n=1 Tax=Aneurinibacillus migulanus TaxID=47500 RepID=UPI000FBDF197|nr:hypothetical protein [Aneurinibacillus migulanus]